MKVLIFTSQFYEIGGIEKLAVELAVDLNKRGIHADILSMYSEDLPNVSHEQQKLLNLGIPNIYFLGLKINPSVLSILKGAFALRKLVKQNGYDIVETSALSPIVIASLALRFTNVKLIAGIHQVFLTDRDCSLQHKVLKLTATLNNKLRYYAISQYALQSWVTYSKTPKEYTRVVYNSVIEEFYVENYKRKSLVEKFSLPNGSKVLVFIGRIIQPKRPDILLEAVADLCESSNLAILFIGRKDFSVDGTREMIEKMDHIIDKNNLSHRIKFIGTTSEVPYIMASADLMVHPTSIEAFGLVLVEAMASGLPIVTTNVEGIPEVVNDTDTIMVPPNDKDLLKSAIISALTRSDQDLLSAVKKGKKQAEKFKTDVRTKTMINLFNDMIKNQF